MTDFLCKAVLDQKSTANTGADWAFAKRCRLKFHENYLQAADVTLPFAQISNATLRIVPSAFFLPGCILSVETIEGRNYHFGLRYSAFWKKDLPFRVERVKTNDPLIWVKRLLILGTISFLGWKIISRFV